MEVKLLEYQGTLTSTPRGPLDVMPDPEVTPVRVDRDWRLVDALRLREATAAERLVATYGDRVYRLAIRITGNEQDAEEAVQDAFWSVVRKIDTFRGDSAFGSWLYRIVSNAAYEKVRRRPQAFVDISLDDILPPFNEDGRHAGMIRDWSSSLDDAALQTELRAVLSSAVSEPDGWAASAGGFPAMTGNVPFLMKDVVLFAVSVYLLRQDVARVSRSAPQSELLLAGASLKATR